MISRKITKNIIKIKKVRKTSDYDIPYYVTDNTKLPKLTNGTKTKSC